MVKRATSADEINKEEPTESQAEVIGEAPAMQEVFRAIGKLSNSNSTVLLNGESGNWKRVKVRALYQHSPRKDKNLHCLKYGRYSQRTSRSRTFWA